MRASMPALLVSACSTSTSDHWTPTGRSRSSSSIAKAAATLRFLEAFLESWCFKSSATWSLLTGNSSEGMDGGSAPRTNAACLLNFRNTLVAAGAAGSTTSSWEEDINRSASVRDKSTAFRTSGATCNASSPGSSCRANKSSATSALAWPFSSTARPLSRQKYLDWKYLTQNWASDMSLGTCAACARRTAGYIENTKAIFSGEREKVTVRPVDSPSRGASTSSSLDGALITFSAAGARRPVAAAQNASSSTAPL
mmetsp:Transcript_11536/g.33972  ORF Transcript_11536/g.33972 Transcript_11536/m.33972 type:complete len:254 (-) Transcript_11536:607-1368(-)